ncbi:microfibril-associated glycoprotein 4-like [Mytilus trossulus]|uniref:microfibril-associated glycoprotein 4-like n=1 Tax=Mytilus trossulus TaxID=6551 RepID=UPI00300786FD
MEKGGFFLTILLYVAVLINQVCYGKTGIENKKKFTIEAGKRIVLSNSTITTKTDSSAACASLCTSDIDCVKASYDKSIKQCILDTDCIPTTENCQNAVLIRISEEFYVKRPTDCGDLDNSTSKSGIYKIFPDKISCFKAFCEMEKHGGGWTVFQRRMNGETHFFIEWSYYKHGFGDQSQEFWLGNDHLHMLTSQGNYRLRIDMEDFENSQAYALYDYFSVGSESSGYILSVSNYSGDAGDSMAFQNGQKFSTKDRDNDVWDGDCAAVLKGAWWYSSCHRSNLNGLYLEGNHTSFADGVNWVTWKGYHYSLKESIMMIRKV